MHMLLKRRRVRPLTPPTALIPGNLISRNLIAGMVGRGKMGVMAI